MITLAINLSPFFKRRYNLIHHNS